MGIGFVGIPPGSKMVPYFYVVDYQYKYTKVLHLVRSHFRKVFPEGICFSQVKFFKLCGCSFGPHKKI